MTTKKKKPSLEPDERQTLEAINALRKEYGMSPTIAEIAVYLNRPKSLEWVSKRLDILEQKERITRTEGKSRSIQVRK